jgi:hypothetical protein
MTDRVLELLEEFAARRARGERPDPLDYLRRAGDDADLLAAHIDRMVQSLPPPPPSAAEVARVRALIDAEPPLLALRLARRLRVQEVVDAVVRALRLPEDAAGRVRERYHELEAGLLDPAGLDGRLRAAVADALGVVEERLPRSAPTGSVHAAGMARGAAADASRGDAAVAPVPSPAPSDADAEVDRLFGVR